MKKHTSVFQLGPMQEPVTIALIDDIWIPLRSPDAKDVFVYGKGTIKIGKKTKKEIIPALETITAKDLKIVKDQYGYNAMLGMIQGWGSNCLFHDNSCGLSYAKMEAYNMADIGEPYDIFTDKVQGIGDHFIEALLANGFSIQGTPEKGTFWYGYKDENDCGHLAGFCGLSEKVQLHPLAHIDHSTGGFRVLPMRMPPQFDPISFDSLLTTLFFSRYYSEGYDKVDKMLEEIVSVRDRIAHLTSPEIADEIGSIFELQKEYLS